MRRGKTTTHTLHCISLYMLSNQWKSGPDELYYWPFNKGLSICYQTNEKVDQMNYITNLSIKDWVYGQVGEVSLHGEEDRLSKFKSEGRLLDLNAFCSKDYIGQYLFFITRVFQLKEIDFCFSGNTWFWKPFVSSELIQDVEYSKLKLVSELK